MNKIRFIILGFVFGLSACHSADEKTETTTADSAGSMKLVSDSNFISDAIDSAHNAQNSLDWAGTYQGVLPCADCEGIATEISLLANNTYRISTQYLGKKDNKAAIVEGKFVWVDGLNIELQGIKAAPSKYFVSENRIVQLDMEGKKITGGLADKYVLKKIK